MSYQDTWAICTKCGQQFVFRIEEQRRQAERGEEITPPALCPDCQSKARAERRPKAPREPTPRPHAEPRHKARLQPDRGPHEGRVKWYDGEKGYGFIAQTNGEEIFFHRTGFAPGETPRISPGTRVTFVIEESNRGPQAVDVARMDVDENT